MRGCGARVSSESFEAVRTLSASKRRERRERTNHALGKGGRVEAYILTAKP